MSSELKDKIMDFYNKPVPKAIKILIQAHKNGEISFDSNKLSDVFSRLLKSDLDFEGNVVVRDKASNIVYSVRNRDNSFNMSYHDKSSLKAKLLEHIPKDGRWYKNQFTNMISRYTPDTVSTDLSVYIPPSAVAHEGIDATSGSSSSVTGVTYLDGDVDTSSDLEETDPDQYWFNVGYNCGTNSNELMPGTDNPTEQDYEEEYNVPSEYESYFNAGYESAEINGAYVGAPCDENNDPIRETYNEINTAPCKVKMFKFNDLYKLLLRNGFVEVTQQKAYETGKYLAQYVKKAFDSGRTIVYFSDIDGAYSFAKGVHDVLMCNVDVDYSNVWLLEEDSEHVGDLDLELVGYVDEEQGQIGGDPDTWSPEEEQ